MSLVATFVDLDTFTVVGDYTADFVVNRKVMCNCGVDGYKYCVVSASAYVDPNTTVDLTADSDDLTANLTLVDWSVVKPGATGNIPLHAHTDEDSGGDLSVGAGAGITMADDTWIGIGAALERIVFDAAGDVCVMGADVGIGTLTPQEHLHLYGAGAQRFEIESSGAASVLFKVTNTAASWAWFLAADGKLHAYDYAGPSYRMTIDLAGYVGYGTQAPIRLVHLQESDAVTNAVTYVQRLAHVSTGTVAADFGVGIELQLEDDGGGLDIAALIEAVWDDATGGGEKGRLVLKAKDSGGEREGLRIEGSGAATEIGFFGVAAATQQAHIADPAGGATQDAEARTAINAILAALETYGLLAAA